MLRRCWYLFFLFLWKIKNVKIVIKSQDHFSYFLLKHARIKTEKYWIINVTIKTSSWLLIYCTIYFLSLDFTRILNIKYAKKRPLPFLSHTNKIVWDYIVWRDLNNQSVLDLLVKKKLSLKILVFCNAGLCLRVQNLDTCSTTCYKHQRHWGYNCNLLQGNSKPVECNISNSFQLA